MRALLRESGPRRVNRDLHTSHFQRSARREGAGQRVPAAGHTGKNGGKRVGRLSPALLFTSKGGVVT